AASQGPKSERKNVGATGLEPVTPSVSSRGHSDLSNEAADLKSPAPGACTPACTSDTNTANATTLETLATVLLGLSVEDRAKLVAMLIAGQAQGEGKPGQ